MKETMNRPIERGNVTVQDGVLSYKLNRENPNHHLWDNNGTWYIHYTFHRDQVIKQRIRQSLKTKSLEEARRRRDLLFAKLFGLDWVSRIAEPGSGIESQQLAPNGFAA